VEHCDHDNRFVRCPKVNGVRKRVEQCSPHIAGHGGELAWPLTDASKRTIDIGEKPAGESRMFFVVPARGFIEIGLGEQPNNDPAGH
jgi:hypothetical protein